KVNAALKAQLDKLWHTTSIYYTEPILEYAEKLTSKFPSHMKAKAFCAGQVHLTVSFICTKTIRIEKSCAMHQ
ncbi:hypothetical protein COOONC_23057, partial [Cooperia oncophora]